nr:hypothetical protein [Tanacetum cinerariifolium]
MPGLSFPTPNAKATSVHDDVGVPDAATNDNAKATSVCDDIDEADAATDDNEKATSVHDAAADDNANSTSVCDDIDQVDTVADDNAMVPIFDVHNMLVDKESVLMKDAHDIINHTDPPVYGSQIMLWGGLEKKGDSLDEAKANHVILSYELVVYLLMKKKRMTKRQRQLPTSTGRRSKRHVQEVVLAADNGEAVKETQLLDSHKNAKGDSVIRLPTCYWKLFEGNPPCALGRESYKRFQCTKDKNARPQRSFESFKTSKEATSLVSLGEWLERRRIVLAKFSDQRCY